MVTAGLILILKDGKPRQEVDLVSNQSLSMGKHPSNSIILPDRGIWSEHMKLQVNEEGQALFDSFGHSNVLVNGRLEQGPVMLNDGDLIEVLRKHDGPRQFVYYSKYAGQANAARKCLQQEQWLLNGPGPSEMSLLASKAPQTSPMTTALPGNATQSCLQQPQPVPQQQQQQFAVPPPAPPCPSLPWLSSLTQQQEAKFRTQATQSAQLHLQCQIYGLAKAAAVPPVAPPLPSLPWIQTSNSAAAKEQQAWRPQQQQQGMQKQAQVLAAAPPAAPPLPPLPFAKHVSTSSAAANTQPQQPSQPGSAQFALAPVALPLPLKPKQSKGSITVKLSSGKLQDVGVQQQQQQPYSGDTSTEVKAPSTSSDVHRLVAQQAAAAALKRQKHMHKPKHSGQLPQAAVAPYTVPEADQLTSVQHQLVQKCSEVQALQAQNTQLQAQVTALQQQLPSSSMAACMQQEQGVQDQESPEATNSEELVEPTLVLQFPLQAASGHTRAVACATDTAAQAQDSGLIGGIAQQPTLSTGSDCGTAQDRSQVAGSLGKHSTAAQPEHAKAVHIISVPCLQPMANVSRCEAAGSEHQQSDGNETDGNAFSSSEQPPSNETVAVVNEQNASPVGQAQVPGGQVTVPDQQHGSPRGQTLIAEGQAATTGQGDTADKQTGLADGVPAVLDDTISEACCVCKSAEDGEVMLLCDKCDQPAHLGCVGVDTVPEGDWFCPSCMPAMVLQSNGAAQTSDTAAVPAAVTEAAAEQMQSPVISFGNDVDAGAKGKDAQGKKQEASKKRKAVPSSTDDAGASEMPARKRSKRAVAAAQNQVDKENMAANATSKKQRQGKRASRPARRATCDEADTDSGGPRRSTRLAHK